MVRAIGGDLVGMSTTLEAIAAREAGLEVSASALVTNLAAGISGEPLNHAEVLEAGRPPPPAWATCSGRIVPTDLTVRVLVTGAAGSIGRVSPSASATAATRSSASTWCPARRASPPPGTRSTAPTRTRWPPSSPSSRSTRSSTSPATPTRPSCRPPLTSHVVTTAALLDAMVEHDVRRFVYASSNHAVGRTPRRDLLRPLDDPPPPGHLLRRRQGRGRGR